MSVCFFISDWTVSTEGCLVNDELERNWKEAVMTQLRHHVDICIND